MVLYQGEHDACNYILKVQKPEKDNLQSDI